MSGICLALPGRFGASSSMDPSYSGLLHGQSSAYWVLHSISFLASTGIRQGCPLSPPIFVLVADLLLRKLRNTLGDNGVARAFADDTAVTLKTIATMPAVMDVFKQYSSSQLVLNFQRTMVIPLFYPEALDTAADEIRRILPTRVGLTYGKKALYLGIRLGPDSIDQG